MTSTDSSHVSIISDKSLQLCDVSTETQNNAASDTDNIVSDIEDSKQLNDLNKYSLKANVSDNTVTIIAETKISIVEHMAIDEAKEVEQPGQEGNCEVSELVKDNETEESATFCYNWSISPKLLTSATEEYQPTISCENFTKGCQWSPDGTCLLVPAEDFRIRIYELPGELYSGRIPLDLPLVDLKPALSVKEGGLIYDSSWYPFMNSWDPMTCCFISTSQETPVHLWDAFTGELRATYRAYNQVDEVEAAISVQFVDSGRKVWCGFKGALRTFDTDRPGRQIDTIYLKKDFPNTFGLVSCIRENPIMPGLVAFGTYSKHVGLYKDGPLCTFKTSNGVTQIEFSPCGTKLYSVVRRSNEFLCWDLRNPGIVLYSLKDRQSDTNQKIQISISTDGSQIVSGGTDGCVTIWKYSENLTHEEDLKPAHRIQVSKDCINGVSLHKKLPIVATSSGQRICDAELQIRDNSVRIWWCS
ncbi:telomerase Cajal body protein 1 [Cephus cinctus]|uniref:WD repeat-containing protein 79 n=1 Tax=Cephus cinctus TaxID=211228 RepID=A0AAJ7C9G1_CEPCN|nr:telomerase Cajal body protein 1 [Cephus cinctus]